MKLLILSGSMGAGKSTILGEAVDLLTEAGVVHAAIEMDGIANHVLPPGVSGRSVALQNLSAVSRNYAEAGVDRLLVANPIEDRQELQQFREATAATEVIVARLRAPLATMQDRVRRREPGMWQQKYVARVQVLEELLDAAAVEDFVVVNDGAVTVAAREVLRRAHWL
jgi:adenylylsulfate kinase-like enzyme